MEQFISSNKEEKVVNSNSENNWNWKRIAIYTTIMAVIGCFIYVYWDDINDLYGGYGNGPNNPPPSPNNNPGGEETYTDWFHRVFLNGPDKRNAYTDPQGNLLKRFEIIEENEFPKDIKGKSVDLSSPGSSSPINVKEVETSSPTGSTSSTETIIAGPSDTLSRTNLLGKSLEEQIRMLPKHGTILDITNQIKDHWRSFIQQDIYDGINYIETHFPKSDIESSDYILTLMKEITDLNMKYAIQSSNLARLKAINHMELAARTEITRQTDCWINKIEEKLRNLE